MRVVRAVIVALLTAGCAAAEAAGRCEPLGEDGARCRLDTLDAGRVNVSRPGRLRRLEIECSDTLHVSSDFAAALGGEFGALRSLSVQRCALGSLRRGVFHRLRRLETLRLSTFSREWTSAEMKLEAGCFEGLEYLETLDLGENNMWSLEPNVFENLASLKVLNLTGNSFQDLVELRETGISDGLQVLDVSDNGLLELSADGLRSFANLRELHAQSNELAVIHDGALRDMKRLELIDVSDNRLVALPAMMLNETRLLRDLRVQNNSIRVLPPSLLSDLPQLQAVNMSSNNLSSEWIRKDTFAGLLRLIVLDLAGNQLDSLSAEVFHNLSSLQVLDLSRNRIKSIESGAFDTAAGLRVIRLDANRLSSVNGLFSKLPALETLNVSDNRIEFFDYALIPPGLRRLDLHANRIREIGNYFSIESMLRLETLDLSHNLVSHIGSGSVPDGIQYFILASNQLETVEPGTLQAKTKLVRADFSSNQLSKLDRQAIILPNVEDDGPRAELLLAGNPFFCDCDMDWLLTIDTMTPRRRYPKVLDADRVMCRLLQSPGRLIPLRTTRPADFLCSYDRHCFGLCHCCDFVACDCEMKCPDGCSCYRDHTWNTNIVDCNMTEQTAISRQSPID